MKRCVSVSSVSTVYAAQLIPILPFLRRVALGKAPSIQFEGLQIKEYISNPQCERIGFCAASQKCKISKLDYSLKKHSDCGRASYPSNQGSLCSHRAGKAWEKCSAAV